MIFKRLYAWFRNNHGIRNKKGIIINDFKRRKASKLLMEEIKSGKVQLPPKVNGCRNYKVNIKAGNIATTGGLTNEKP